MNEENVAPGPGCRLPQRTLSEDYRLYFVARDRTADAIFLTVQACLLRFAEMAGVFRHIRLLGILEVGFAPFQASGLLRTQPAILHTIGECAAADGLLSC